MFTSTLLITIVSILWFGCGLKGARLIRRSGNQFNLDDTFPYWLIRISGLVGLMAGIMIWLDWKRS